MGPAAGGGERELVSRIAAALGRAPAGELWAGDDGAVITTSNPCLLAIDTVVENVDFDLSYCSGADIGWKALAANVSDIAAMGGRPSHAVVSVSLRRDVGIEWVDDFVSGLGRAAERWSVGVAGGDLGAGSEISVTIAIVGALEDAPVLRSGAHEGDVLCVTGSLGGARAGLVALRAGARERDAAHERLALRQLRPQARVEEGAALARAGATSMVDLSDGLAVDLGHLVEASGLGCEVKLGDVPVDPLIYEAPDLGIDPTDTAVIGGEDFELLVTIAPGDLAAASEDLAGLAQLTRIGTVGGTERRIGDRALDEWRRRGWQHLQER